MNRSLVQTDCITRIILGLMALTCALSVNAPVRAQVCTPGGFHGWDPTGMTTPDPLNCLAFFACYQPLLEPVVYVPVGGCDPNLATCTVRAQVRATFRANHLNVGKFFGESPVRLIWNDSGGGFVGSCGSGLGAIFDDIGDAWIQAGGFSCLDPNAATGTDEYTLRVLVCPGATDCPRPDVTVPVPLTAAAMEAALCPPPPIEYHCGDGSSCQECMSLGGVGGAGFSAAGSPSSAGGTSTGGGAFLHYRGGGVGIATQPGAATWNVTLGRYWSHSYAERIVEEAGSVAWLLTRRATFTRFQDGNSDGIYEDVSPADEYRILEKLGDGSFELRDLDGTVDRFDSTGKWTEREDRAGNAKVATYTGGVLTRVDFPDGRHEDFAYHPSGKLASITEVDVGGSPSRTWSYTWSGNDLVRVDRPDGTAIEYLYDDPAHPGYMSRITLVGTDSSERIDAAFEYDSLGNVVTAWRGTAGPSDPGVVDKWTLSFDDPALPTVTTVTDPLGGVSTYTLAGRANRSKKPRLVSLSGSCPTCGLGPNTQLTYGDAANPFRPTQEIDGNGTVTVMSYDVNGQMTSRIEAFGTALERETTWEYDPIFPAFVMELVRPSVTGNPLDERRTSTVYDAEGNATLRTIEGFEDGSTFSLATTTAYNGAGQPTLMDPPGFGTADETSFTYDPARGDLLPLTRTEPVVGTTSFGYDGFNRRTSVTDPNGVETVTTYDALNRVPQVTHKGAVAADDLVTEHEYNVFGDLLRTTLPRGNVIEYGYDGAGRVVSIERKPDASTPAERTLFTLDAFGHRTREELQRWDGASWVTESVTDYVYSTRCHLDQIIHADGSVTEFDYDCDGNLAREWDANHPSAGKTNPATRVYTYDALDRLTSVTEPWGGAGGGTAVTSYGYDVQDHLVSVIDGEASMTAYTFSDRDLLTEEDSPVSGVTTHGYDEHGSLTSTTDARPVTVSRTYDAADRLTFVDYPDPDLDTSYTYDDPGVSFSQGRLTAITRDGRSVDYEYNRFGRTTRDGGLTYAYDKNGNRTGIGYPDGSEARYTHDFADREATLELEPAGGSPETVVLSATYYPSGPLSSLELGNGLTETRVHDQRYFPARITVAPTGGGAALLDWQYTTDDVGNPTLIDDLLGGTDRVYAYQDVQYFLTQGDGPWGTLDWTYDRIGSRLTQGRNGGAVDVYTYQQNSGALGNTAKLASIQHGAGGTTTFSYDAAGNQTQTNASGTVTDWTYDDASRLSRIEQPAAELSSDFFYDGRSFLRLAESRETDTSGNAIFCDGFESGDTSNWGSGPGTCPEKQGTIPVYGSEGLLNAKDSAIVLYFASRPVAAFDSDLEYINVDHLGTPSMLTDAASSVVWEGGFEPFGGDFSGALAAGKFLRLPGQWDDSVWSSHNLDGLYYNVYRWYLPSLSRYIRRDPAWHPRRIWDLHHYTYVTSNPIGFIDLLGLERIRVCCNEWDKQNLKAILDHTAEIQAYIISNAPDPGPVGNNPYGDTECERIGSNSGGRPTTTYYNFGPGDCVNACTRVHEQHHRDICKQKTLNDILRSNNALDEGIAYAHGAGCLTDALHQGHVDIDVDPIGPRNIISSERPR